MFDFHLISLCNVIYKIVTKTISNRMKTVLPSIISKNQSAFTPGRLITDNILVAYKLFNYMRSHNSTNGAMTLKLNMSKDFDRVE